MKLSNKTNEMWEFWIVVKHVPFNYRWTKIEIFKCKYSSRREFQITILKEKQNTYDIQHVLITHSILHRRSVVKTIYFYLYGEYDKNLS